MADVAIVGSSPRLLLEAAAEARAGNDVVVFTNGEPFGGAWWVDDVAGFSNVETACHLLEADPVGYEVLRSVDGVQLAPMDPLPRVHAGRLSLGYGGPAAVAAIAAIGVPAVVRAGWREARQSNIQSGFGAARASTAVRVTQARNDLGARSEPILYPVGGAGALLSNLRKLAAAEGVGFDDRSVLGIDTSPDSGCRLGLADAELLVGRAVVSAGFSGPVVRGGGWSDAPEDRKHEHLLLVVPSEVVRPLSYDRYMTDQVLLRASDVTSSAVANDPAETGDQTLLMIGTRRPVDHAEAHEVLLTQGILTEPTDFHDVVRYTHHSRNRAVALGQAAAGSPVDVLDTFGDLSRSLRSFANRHPTWMSAPA